ncbi:MAG: hypothetical protein RR557_07815 [Bacilli bacterium]
MKKVLFGLGVLAVLSFPVVGNAELKLDRSDDPFAYTNGWWSNDHRDEIKYVYSNDYEYLEEIRRESGSEDYDKSGGSTLEIFDNFGFIKRSDLLNLTDTNGSEGGSSSIEILQFAENLEYAYLNDRITDFRPLLETKKMKKLDINSPASSIHFLKNMSQLEDLSLDLDSSLDEESSFYPVISDVSVLNYLNNLNEVSINSTERPFPTVSLKKSMNKYVLVNPFILSKQFKNPDVKITSKTPGFAFEDDILTWDGITPNTKELQISWNFSSEENGFFRFRGESVIPINWID